MKATTHTEVYRPFVGKLTERRLRFLPLARAGIRTAFREKRALVLFAPPLIATVIFSFVVYAKFALESGQDPMPGRGEQAAGPMAMMGSLAGDLIQVRAQIVNFHATMNLFVLLVLAWYGAGLIAEDRRLKAHLLYFARPITLLDYVVGKFLVAAAYAALATVLPGLVICTVAAAASPEWAFVTQQGDVIWKMLLFSLVSLVTLTSVVLAISSLAPRKTHALAATLGFFMLNQGVASVLAQLQRDRDWLMGSIFDCLLRVGAGMFDMRRVMNTRMEWSLTGSWLVLAGVVVAAWILILWRVRRMEVVS